MTRDLLALVRLASASVCAVWNSRQPRAPLLFENMSFDQTKFLVLSAWVATVITIGLILTVDRPSLWVVVATVAVIPASVASWLWTAPPVTLSQLIQKYRK